MMSMMENYFSIRKESEDIFCGLAISEHVEFCREWMNQYPVLFVSFKDIEAETFDGAYKMLKMKLADLCKSLSPIFEEKSVDKDDEFIFAQLKSRNAGEDEVINSIKIIMRMMNAVYGKKVILLIDEYDVPLAQASEKDTPKNEYYSKMLDVIKRIMSAALKDNEFLQFAVITGCLRIAKESIFTGTNKFASYSVLDQRFSRYFGFLGDEVEMMLKIAKIADRKEAESQIKEWYDGYLFGDFFTVPKVMQDEELLAELICRSSTAEQKKP